MIVWSSQLGNSWPRAGQRDKAVDCSTARPIVRYRVYWVSLLLAGLAFLLQLLEARDDDDQQLDDDAGRDVRHDARARRWTAEQRAAAEKVDQRVDVVLAPWLAWSRQSWIASCSHARRRDEAPSRNRAMMPSVKSSFLRRSGVRNAEAKARARILLRPLGAGTAVENAGRYPDRPLRLTADAGGELTVCGAGRRRPSSHEPRSLRARYRTPGSSDLLRAAAERMRGHLDRGRDTRRRRAP